MSATTRTRRQRHRATSDPMRGRARLAGVLYVITFVSIPTLWLYKPAKDHADFVLGAGSTTGVMAGAFSEVIVGLAGTATAVVLFPVLKRQSESAALGVVTARVVETALIFTGVVSLLTLITLRTDVAGTAGADRASLITAGHTQVAVYNSTFLLSQALMPVIVDALLGYLLYRSRLVPRALADRRPRSAPRCSSPTTSPSSSAPTRRAPRSTVSPRSRSPRSSSRSASG